MLTIRTVHIESRKQTINFEHDIVGALGASTPMNILSWVHSTFTLSTIPIADGIILSHRLSYRVDVRAPLYQNIFLHH